MVRLIFYYNHYNSLGHSLRSFNLLSYLRRHCNWDILIFQGGKKQQILPFDNFARVVVLPHSYAKKGMFIDRFPSIHSKILSTNWAMRAMEERKKLMFSVIGEFKPDIFITEYYPLGDAFWTHELTDLLEYVLNFTDRIYSSCGYASPVEYSKDVLKRYYRRVFIHSPEEFLMKFLMNFRINKIDKDKFLSIFKDFRHKISYTGFILDKKISPMVDVHIERPFILISRGGGVINNNIISLGIVLAKMRPELNFVMVLGPSTSKKDFLQVQQLVPRNVRLFWYVSPSEFNFLLKHCRISINMAGYNTIAKLLYFRKPTIIYPLDAIEQLARANMISEFLPARMVKKDKLSLKKCVSQWIDELMNVSVNSCFDGDDFNGEEKTLEGLINDM